MSDTLPDKFFDQHLMEDSTKLDELFPGIKDVKLTMPGSSDDNAMDGNPTLKALDNESVVMYLEHCGLSDGVSDPYAGGTLESITVGSVVDRDSQSTAVEIFDFDMPLSSSFSSQSEDIFTTFTGPATDYLDLSPSMSNDALLQDLSRESIKPQVETPGPTPRKRRRPLKPKLHERQEPYSDEELERKRQNAIKAKVCRDLKKNQFSDLKRELNVVKRERDELFEKVKSLQLQVAQLQCSKLQDRQDINSVISKLNTVISR